MVWLIILLALLIFMWIFIAILSIKTGIENFIEFLFMVTPLNTIVFTFLIGLGIYAEIINVIDKKRKKKNKELNDMLSEKMKYVDPYGEEIWSE